jgi:uncharacterized protein (TIGR03435 family)
MDRCVRIGPGTRAAAGVRGSLGQAERQRNAAVQEQLGLKLESARGPVEYLVIESIDRPTPD